MDNYTVYLPDGTKITWNSEKEIYERKAYNRDLTNDEISFKWEIIQELTPEQYLWATNQVD